MSRVFGVIACSSCSAVMRKPWSMPAVTKTGLAPAINAMSGYDTQ